jgi:hypothetical protein
MDETNLEPINPIKMFTQTHNVGSQNQAQTGTKIYETMNYEIFSLVSGNRELSTTKVNQLIGEIRLNGLLMPIMVNGAMQVIDGQHRLAACKKANIPVQYFVRAKATVETAANVNMAGSNWSPSDWINKYASDGNKDYIDLQKWIKRCAVYGIRQMSAIHLAQNSAANISYWMYSDGQIRINGSLRVGEATNSNTLRKLYNVGGSIRVGKWKFGNKATAEDLLDTVLLFRDCAFYHRTSFVTAIIRVSRIKNFDAHKLQAQFLKYPEKFTDERSSDRFLRMFEDVYNFGRNQKNRLAIVNNPELQKK